ncbi:MAG TPA: polyprenyl synthetase family protein [Marmoricola sp.]|nr:polyprenyl synthetase family protein [Marmoricola sp.]
MTTTATEDHPPRTGSSDEALDRVLADGLARARQVGPDHVALWTALTEATRGGKRFRPALAAAAYDMLGGTDQQAVGVLGAALELLHTAFVIHDDVIDGDDVRRGRPNVSGGYASTARAEGASSEASSHLGSTAAILAGDLALASAIRTVALCPAEPRTVRRLLDLFDHALHTTAAGELADVRFGLGTRDPSLAESLTMEEQKTSAYSFALPLQAGAVLAGADEITVHRLGEAGRMLGIAFQLLDDLLGVFGDPAATGKSVLTDLREGKQTPLIAHARTTSQWEGVAAHLGSPELTEDDAEVVRGLLVASGSRRFVEELAADYVRGAGAAIDRLGLSLDRLDVLGVLTAHAGDKAA